MYYCKQCSEDALKRFLSSQILNGSRPDRIINVEVRFTLYDLNPACCQIFHWRATLILKKSWNNIFCIDSSRLSGVQSEAIAVVPKRSSVPVLSRTPSCLSLHGNAVLDQGGRPNKIREETLIPDSNHINRPTILQLQFIRSFGPCCKSSYNAL